MSEASESRRRPRTEFAGWVEITSQGERRRARGIDLSAEGIGMELEAPHPAVESPVRSEFALPGIGLPLELEGRVAWTDPGTRRVGLCFQAVDPGLSELLNNFVAGRF